MFNDPRNIRRESMKVTHLAVVLVCGLLVATAATGLDPASSEPSWKDAAFVVFDVNRVPDPGVDTTATIEYQVNGKPVLEKRVAFNVDPDHPTFVVVVPSPSSMVRAGGADRLTLNVWLEDELYQSFDAASFASYNRMLRAAMSDRLEAAYHQSGTRESEWPLDTTSREIHAPTAVVVPTELSVTKAGDPCVLACTQAWRQCYAGCRGSDPCMVRCDRDWTDCEAGCPNGDVDNDSVVNQSDNCVYDYNPNQADCDGDGLGNVCDSLNAHYVYQGGPDTCWTDKDSHIIYFTFEHHIERRQHDTSSCGAPDIYDHWIGDDANCFNISDYNCCMLLSTSIQSVGDDPQTWCTPPERNTNYCH
jgi:hypothetical protein